MSEGIRNLQDNLEKQVAIYEQIHTLEREKKEALVQNNIREIEAITARQEKLILAANRLENERLLWIEHIARELGKTPEELTLAELAEHFPLLEKVRSDLERVVRQLQEIQGINAQLLQQAMRIVNYTLDLLTHQQSNTYLPPDGKSNRPLEEGKKKHLMDWRI